MTLSIENQRVVKSLALLWSGWEFDYEMQIVESSAGNFAVGMMAAVGTFQSGESVRRCLEAKIVDYENAIRETRDFLAAIESFGLADATEVIEGILLSSSARVDLQSAATGELKGEGSSE